MILIRHDGRPAAWVAGSKTAFAPWIDVLEADHPTRRWVACKAIFAMHVLDGTLPAAYTDERADLFARGALLPNALFCELADLPAAWLAEHFNVPLPQIAEKRDDLRALAIF